METLETTFAGKSVTVTADNCPDAIRVSIKTVETSIFGDTRTIALGYGEWLNGSFEFCTAVCSAKDLDALASELRAHGWN